MNCRHHTFNLSWRPHLLMASRPSIASSTVSSPLLVSFMDESYHLPRLLTGSWLNRIWCATVNVACILPFLTERLRNFFGLNFMLHHATKTSRRSNTRRVSSGFEPIMVVSSMNAFKGGGGGGCGNYLLDLPGLHFLLLLSRWLPKPWRTGLGIWYSPWRFQFPS